MLGFVTQGEVKTRLNYDPETGVFTWRINSSRAKAGAVAGTVNSRGYVIICIRKRGYMAHRLAWFYVHGYWPPEETDHINGDRADNRLSNLRLATKRQNMHNRKRQVCASSPYKGVSIHHAGWSAEICTPTGREWLGLFRTPEEAAERYQRRAREVQKEFYTERGNE